MLKALLVAALMAVPAALPSAASADGHGHGGRGAAFCPPGLASKGCMPPGQAKKQGYRYRDDHARRDDDNHYWYTRRQYDDRDRYARRYYEDEPQVVIRLGDRIDNRYVRVDPYRYGLDPRWNYYSYDDRLFRVDPNTMKVVALMGLLNALLN